MSHEGVILSPYRDFQVHGWLPGPPGGQPEPRGAGVRPAAAEGLPCHGHQVGRPGKRDRGTAGTSSTFSKLEDKDMLKSGGLGLESYCN